MARPALLTAYRHTDTDGTVLNHGQYLVSRLWLGLGPTDAARATGLHPGTVTMWLRRGRVALQLQEAGQPVPETERPYVAFVADYEDAEAHAKERLLTAIYQAGTDPQRATKVTVKYETNAEGVRVEVERTETTEERPPQWTALAWIAERRWPETFGRRIVVDSGPDKGESESTTQAKALSDELDAYLAGLDDARKQDAIEVTAVTSDDG